MKSLWFGAAAAAALLSAALPAAAQSAPGDRQLHMFHLHADEAGASHGGAQRMGAWGFDLDGMNRTIRPGDDFFAYANGAYVDALEIPADRSRFGVFDALNELSIDRMHAVLERSAADPQAQGDTRLIADFYRSYMDQARAEALGAEPLAADLAAVRQTTDHASLARLMGQNMKGFGGSFFSAYVYDDAKSPDRYTVYFGQAGLGMPDRDYYLEERFSAQKEKYQAYVAQLLTLVGWPEPEARAADILAMETKIAQVSWTRAERRDDDKTYNPYTLAELQAFAPAFPWQAFAEGADLGGVPKIVASENTAFPKIAEIFQETPVEVHQAWAAYTLADQAAPYLSNAFVQAHHEFREKTLSGQPEQRPRWKRAVSAVDSNVGEALGRLYVAEYFPPESKAKMDALVADVKTAMRGRIERLTWMGDETKAKALEKLSKFTVKIGYPEEWRDYGGLEIRADDLYGNIERAAAFDWAFRVGRLDQPVDPNEWGMTPPTVNAYYSPTKNQIVFPAAILQPPFFDPEADPAINYGAIGGVIGHEITHGFDDQGRKSDGDGRLADWWTAQDAERFMEQARKLGAQYSAIEPLPGLRINGDLSMGENIADLGGLLLGLDAYRLSLQGQEAPVIDGFSGEQRVFLGWAQVWRGKYREDALRRQLVTGPHSPGEYRVNVPITNIDAWYEAYEVQPENRMYVAPEDRVRIW